MAKYLVTGGAGFIGSNIVKELVLREEEVRVIDNFFTGRIQNIESVIEDIELIKGDINDASLIRRSMDGIDYVLHQAAVPSVARSINDPITTNQVNITGTLNVLTAARDARVKRVVYASSSSIYGANLDLPKRENMQALPISPYALSKYAGERYCQIFTELYGLETVCLRYFNVFGPNQDPNSEYAAVIPRFITAIKKGKSPIIYGDGTQSRDFTYVKNVVKANLLACEAKNAAGRVFNIACGEKYSLIRLVEMINKSVGKNIAADFAGARQGEVKHSLADISKARQMLGYGAEYDLLRGLKETINSVT